MSSLGLDLKNLNPEMDNLPPILRPIGNNCYFPSQIMYRTKMCRLVLSESDRAKFGVDSYHQPAIIG